MTEENIEVKQDNPLASRRNPSGWSYRPRIDVIEDANEFTVVADVPGATAEDIRINFEAGTLRFHGTVSARQDVRMEFASHEYGVGDFDRELTISDSVDAENINAEYERGVLTIHLPKSESSKPRRISVRAV